MTITLALVAAYLCWGGGFIAYPLVQGRSSRVVPHEVLLLWLIWPLCFAFLLSERKPRDQDRA